MPICGGHAKRPAPMAERRGACPSWAGKRQAPEASLALSCGVTLAELCSKACANARKTNGNNQCPHHAVEGGVSTAQANLACRIHGLFSRPGIKGPSQAS